MSRGSQDPSNRASPAEPASVSVSRRAFLRGAVTLVVAPPAFAAAAGGVAPGCGPPAMMMPPPPGRPTVLDGWPIPLDTALTPERYATLAALMDALIPGDATAPGANDAQAAWYVDQLLGAFRSDPPRIFAGGPYSGRNGGEDGFSGFQRLTRVEELRWRTYLEGSRGMPEREWNGPVVGLIERYERGLDGLEERSMASMQRAFRVLRQSSRRSFLQTFDREFVALSYEHAVEGTYGDPVYGGNFERRGWQAIDFEGDRQPIGYTARQMSHPEEG